MTSVFVSYRRDDSAGSTGRLVDQLRARFGEQSVFMDVDSIAIGADFPKEIEKAIARSDALLAVIGQRWLTVESSPGRRRIDDPDDFVRIEVGTALAQNILVVPVVVDGAVMPAKEELPFELVRLATRNNIALHHDRFKEDFRRLVETLEEIEPRSAARLPVSEEATPPPEPAPTRMPVEELHPVSVIVVEVDCAAAAGGRTPAEVQTLLAECGEEIERAVTTYGGVLRSRAERTSGAALWPAYFGVLDDLADRSGAHEDNPERAALAALRILEHMRDLETACDVTGLEVRIGLDTVRALLGHGRAGQSEDLDERTAEVRLLGRIGDNGAVVVGEGAAGRLERLFELESIAPLPNGADRTLSAWRLTGPRPAEPERLRPLVGRRDEITTLHRLVDELRDGRGQVVGITGQAGVGKSRLVRELRILAEPHVTWLGGRCLSYGSTMTYWPARQALRSFLGVVDGDSNVALRLRARLRPVLGEHLPEVVPYLGELLGVRLDPEDAEKVRYLREEELAEQVHRAYSLFLEALAARGPVVVAIEDLHWADSATGRLVTSLLPLTERAAVLLVADFRLEKPSAAWDLYTTLQDEYRHRFSEIALRSLPEADARELVTAGLQGAEVDEAAMTAVMDRADGNPLYLEQLLSALLEFGRMGPYRSIRVDPGALSELPPSLEDLLVARIDRLQPASARQLAQVAAVVGRRFLRRVLERAADDTDLDDDLLVLVRQDLLQERRFPELAYLFSQNLLQEAAASTVTPALRRQLHARTAVALEELFADTVEDHVEVLAHHFSEAGDHAKAGEYAERAGHRAAGLFANSQAVDWWERARDFASKLGDEAAVRRLTRQLADLQARTGAFARAVTRYRELAHGVTSPDERADLLGEAAWVVLDADGFEESRGLVEEAEAAVPRSIPAKAALELARIRSAWFQGKIDQMGAGLEGLEKLEPERLPHPLDTRRMQMWDTYLCAIEDYEQAASWEAQLIDLAQESGDPLQLIGAKLNLSITKTQSGDPLGGRQPLEEAYLLAQRVGYRPVLTKVGCNLLYTHYLLGSLPDGIALGQELLPKVTSDRWRVMTLLNLGWVELESGRSVARDRFLAARNEAHRIGQPRLEAEATVALVATELAEGRFADADKTLRDVLQRSEAESGVRLQLRSYLSQLALQHGDPEAAETEALAGLSEKAHAAEKVPLWRLLGQALEARQPGSGREAFDQCLALARSTGRKVEEGRALIAISRTRLVPDSEAIRASARLLFVQCGAARDLLTVDQPGKV